jgi:hypothetical protein
VHAEIVDPATQPKMKKRGVAETVNNKTGNGVDPAHSLVSGTEQYGAAQGSLGDQQKQQPIIENAMLVSQNPVTNPIPTTEVNTNTNSNSDEQKYSGLPTSAANENGQVNTDGANAAKALGVGGTQGYSQVSQNVRRLRITSTFAPLIDLTYLFGVYFFFFFLTSLLLTNKQK